MWCRSGRPLAAFAASPRRGQSSAAWWWWWWVILVAWAVSAIGGQGGWADERPGEPASSVETGPLMLDPSGGGESLPAQDGAQSRASRDVPPTTADEPSHSGGEAPDTPEAQPEDRKSSDSKESAGDLNDSPGDRQDSSDRRATGGAVGEPLAPQMVQLLQAEIVAGLKRRGIVESFQRFERYAASRLQATAGPYTGSELTGNCRLRWYSHLLLHPLAAPLEAEQFTRQLHEAALAHHSGLAEMIAMAAEKLDLRRREPREMPPPETPKQALDMLKTTLIEAQSAMAAALAPLSKSELAELRANLYPVFVSQNNVGHTLANRGTGRRLCDILERMDRNALCDAAEALARLVDPALLEQLRRLPAEGSAEVEGASGTLIARIDTPAGAILVGGPGPNSYQLDRIARLAAVVDLGGNDVYVEGACSLDRPVLVLLDLGGDDTYRASNSAAQGGAILGASLLVDTDGNDVYQARDVAQGSSIGGVGLLIDCAGSDSYVGFRRVQGQALCGLGILIDRAGDDKYRGALWTQGMGAPLGFAVLDDLDGRDHYYTGGYYLDSYPETPGYEGWGQGVGAGLRQVANGGIGVILDGGGDDVYEFDYLAHGGGYWCGVGFARDFGGNDQRLGATRQAYDGQPRRETRFQRFANGYACHYAVGFLFDDAGDDAYGGTIMGTGFAWDCAAAYLFDFAGNDRYEATGGGTQGNGAQAGLGVLFDRNGDDVYLGYGQGNASASISYHALPECGGNFSFVVDYGGTDKYGCGAKNNSYIERGSRGGFLIDRPAQDESPPTAEKATAGRRPGG